MRDGFTATNDLVSHFVSQVSPGLDPDGLSLRQLDALLAEKGFMAYLIAHPDRNLVSRYQDEQAFRKRYSPRIAGFELDYV
jgi:hypothetical protein